MSEVSKAVLNDEYYLGDAETYIAALTGSPEAEVTFQTLPEGGPSSAPPQIIHGRLADVRDRLVALNRAGHGIFVMVNEGDGLGRRKESVRALRAVFTDDDGKGVGSKPPMDAAPSSIRVRTKNGEHCYWKLEPGEPLDAFTTAQTALAEHFGTDPAVTDLPRVMRVPGFWHQKNRDAPFKVKVIEVRSVRYTIPHVLGAFGISTPVTANSQRSRADDDGVTGASGQAQPVDPSVALRCARAFIKKIDGAVQGDNGDRATYRVGCALLRDFALSEDDALTVFREWNQKCTPPWSERDLVDKLRNAERYATGELGSKLVHQPRDFEPSDGICFVVPLSRYFARNSSGGWSTAAPLDDRGAKAHLRSVGVEEDRLANVMAFQLMPLVHGIDCSPSDQPLFEREDRLFVNSYRPSRVVPAPGEYPRIQRIMDTICAGEIRTVAWLFNWTAAKYQDPGARSLTAVVARGAQGTAKTKYALIVAELLGRENTASISQADLESAFNGHFATKLFVIADEVANRDTLRDSSSILKKYVTDPRIMVNVKNVPQYEVDNRMSWWFTSNSEIPVKVEGQGDRRYTVLSAFTPPTADYKAMLEGIHDRQGRFTADFQREMAAFAHALRTHTVDYGMARTPLANAARTELITASRSSAEAFWAEVGERGIDAIMDEHYGVAVIDDNPWDLGQGRCATRPIYEAYKRFCAATGMQPSRDAGLGHAMRTAFPEARRDRTCIAGKRPYVYMGLPRTPSEEM